MKTIALKEFIISGKFGAITIGSTRDDIINLLGREFDFADCGETQIVKYGGYEFFYWTKTGKVFGIQNDHLQADCVNHSEMINFSNNQWTLDKWFLMDNENITFGQVVEHLNQENIAFNVVPVYKGCDENIIKCVNSNVTFDFVNAYRLAELNAKGEFKNWKEVSVENQSDYVLNGIRLFEY